MKINTLTLDEPDYPDRLKPLDQPAAELFYSGAPLLDLLKRPLVGVVGSRKLTPYGRGVTQGLVTELVRAGAVIVSGLAIGVDAVAHRAALEAGGATIAVLPSSIDKIYPRSHTSLARQIAEQGGALVTEYSQANSIHAYQFIARNRIIAALSDVLLITEAAEKSGSLHTAQFALELGRDVFAVPGNITSPTSAGTNNLLKAGAQLVTDASDILQALGLLSVPASLPTSDDPHEQLVLNLLHNGVNDAEELQKRSQLDVSSFSQTLTMLEINGHIKPLGANQWSLR